MKDEGVPEGALQETLCGSTIARKRLNAARPRSQSVDERLVEGVYTIPLFEEVAPYEQAENFVGIDHEDAVRVGAIDQKRIQIEWAICWASQ